ncbi:predicted protein [Arabidopsis lyrata subsp. lyrata]|uniref:Predicted protein n=1 Tax=Arabidopsis lyrata subsp. lyrata TaxID=81972 RepID=D7MNK5_ARALL|nr:predicted protein [Arabidopsis lyrata subsp. lyrata]
MNFNFDTPPNFPSDFHDSSSSSDDNENMEMINNLEQEEQAIHLAIANNNSIIQYLFNQQNNNAIHGSSVQGRSFVHRDRETAHASLFNDYLSETPVYNRR